ncbi:MAG: glycosyltransferase [Acetobacteraceae bacterium]|nr:glycosyltransferase [Acetobacteraceae bacterium]
MRLAQVMAGARLGGIELFFERLTPALAEHGHEVVSIIRRNPVRAAKLRAAGVEVSELPFGGYFDLLTWGRLRRLLQGFKPEVVIGWSNRANRFIPNGPWVRVGRPGGYYNLKYYKDCDHIAYTTHSLVRWAVEQGWPRQRAHRVPNFVDDPAGTPPASRSSLGVPEGVPLALAMGRLHRNKGFDTLLNAVARLPDLHLLLAGEGPEERALRRHAANLGISGRVRFLGWRQDGPALRAAADLFVISSNHEPFGSIVPEAWASSLPLVSTAAQGPAEVIRHQEDGLLVPCGDAEALADAMRAVLADPAGAAVMAAAGRRRFEAEYSRPAVLRQWNEFLQRINP